MKRCNCKNGGTYLEEILPVPMGASPGTSTPYYIRLNHHICGNKKICINSQFPLAANLSFSVLGTPTFIAQDTYSVDVLITGSVTYLPYTPNRCCEPCPRQDYINVIVSVPVMDGTSAPVVTLKSETPQISLAKPANVTDCSNVTDEISIETVVTVTSAPAK